MTGNEPGWYRDPAPPHPDHPTTLRYWDGQGWTAEVKHASRAQREQWLREDAERQYAAAVAAIDAASVGAVAPGGTTVAPDLLAQLTAPELSGWWRRVLAVVIDSLVAGAVATLLSWPWLVDVFRAYESFLRLVVQTPEGDPLPPTDALLGAVAGPLVVVGLINLAVKFVYDVGFLKAFAATPGKLVLGIEVRLLERPGVLPWRTVLVRWLTQNPSTLARFLPGGVLLLGASLVTGIYSLVDSLWPLGDRNNQAIHDKAARTVVVRR